MNLRVERKCWIGQQPLRWIAPPSDILFRALQNVLHMFYEEIGRNFCVRALRKWGIWERLADTAGRIREIQLPLNDRFQNVAESVLGTFSVYAGGTPQYHFAPLQTP